MTLRHWILSVPLLIALALPGLAPAQITVSVNVAPPELPVYDQPPIPADGYLWTPGYWAWNDDDQDYYWVPGTWVEAPEAGYLWTPGYWGADGGAFLWHTGYWGPQVGFYGGVNYGYGYGGSGYQGGYWQGGHMYYNRSVSNIGQVHVTNVYNKTVINNVTVNRVSFNGGNGGVRAQPTQAEQRADQARHIGATPMQRQQEQTAHGNQSLRASVNHGSPPIAATSRPGAFSGGGVVAAHHTGTMSVVGAQSRPNNSSEARPNSPSPRPAQQHPEQRPETQRSAAPRPEQAPRPEATPRPDAGARPEAPRQEAAPRPEAPRPAAAPPPRPEAHPQQRQPEHPPERPPEH